MNKKQLKLICLIIAFILSVTGLICKNFILPDSDKIITSSDVTRVSFLDVGQGDSTLIELSNGEVMLIDTGEYEYRKKIADTLKEKGIEKIDYLIATHPHSDHIGSMAYIINNFDIGTFYMPNITHNIKAFEKMLEALDSKKVTSKLSGAGDIIFNKDSLCAQVLSPVEDEYDEMNNYSLVVKLICGKKSFLFTGDAETYAENLITADVNSDVLKVGHHGSSTSTGKKFLTRVSPDYAVISCGNDNSYGHPHDEIIELLEDKNIPVYRTDTNGTVEIICDGKNINVLEE